MINKISFIFYRR